MDRIFKMANLLLFFCQATSAFATNPKFMPGDACFPVVLTQEVADQIAKSETDLKLNYHSLASSGFFCGYVGHREIVIQNAPPVWREHIVKIYQKLRARRPRQIQQSFKETGELDFEEEVNGFIMFVQNRELDFDKYRVGFRYNEDWMDAWPTDPKLPAFAKYQPHFNGFEDVANDWRYAKLVDGLKVDYPAPITDAAIEVERHYGRGPVTGSANDLCLVILPDDDLDSHSMRYSKVLSNEAPERFSPTHDNLIVLDSRGVWRFTRKDEVNKYQVEAWDREAEIKGWSE